MNRFFLLPAAALLSAAAFADAVPLTGWAQLDDKNAIRIVNRPDYTDDNFSGAGPGKEDDQVILDFMDYAGNKDLSAVRGADGASFSGSFKGVFDFKGSVTVISPNVLEYGVELSAAAPQEMKESCFSLRFNRAMLDRELRFTIRAGEKSYVHKVKIEAEHKGGWIWSSPKGQSVTAVAIPMMQGELRLSGFDRPAMVCKYGTQTGNLRIYLESGKVSSISQKLKIEFLPWKAQKLDLSKAANVGFTDEKADDRQGGWTDQGPENDMRALKPGVRRFGNIEFELIDPAENGGKSALAFANPERSWFLREAEADGGGRRMDYLYLLNAAAWCRGGEVGEIEVSYADGGKQRFDVRDRRDTGNWWTADGESFENATLIRQAQNPSALTGLYLSRYKLSGKPVSKITFRTAGKAVWLVVAAAGVAGDPPFPQGSDIETPFEFKAGREWKTFTFHKDRVAGSALDFSGRLDAPAGKYGRVVVRNGRFVFENRPEVPARFLGANICADSNYLEHAQTDVLVDRIAKAGYNAVRLHHFDNQLVKPDAATPEFADERLDKLFYLIAKAKERGLYVTIDLYISRLNGFDRKYGNGFDTKSRMMFSQPMRDNLKEYARKLLTTENPYTKLALKDDPVLITVGLINEDPMLTIHSQYRYPNPDPERNALIKPVFEAWCAKNGVNPAENPERAVWVRFLLDHHIAIYEELKSYLTGIGVKAPVSDISCTSLFALAVPRSRFDYVDNHFYFDHPTFPKEFFKMPFQNHNRNPVATLFRETLRVGSSRIIGKPFTVTEFNFCAPNRFRGAGGPVMGALASLQEWDGIFRFQFTGYDRSWPVKPLEDGGHLGSFSAENDPMMALSELAANLFYLRGDVLPSQERSVLTVTPEVWRIPQAAAYMDWATRENADIPECFGLAGLTRRIGMSVIPVGAKEPSGAESIREVLKSGKYVFRTAAPELFDPAAGKFVSSTGEIFTDRGAETFKVVTPKSEALVVPGKALAGKRLAVRGSTVPATVFAGALDDRPLDESRRILVLHLTDVKATGQKFGVIRGQMRMYNWGNFRPYLALRGKAEISLAIGGGSFTVNALGPDGATLGSVPVRKTADGIAFEAATDMGPGNSAVFAYELIRR